MCELRGFLRNKALRPMDELLCRFGRGIYVRLGLRFGELDLPGCDEALEQKLCADVFLPG